MPHATATVNGHTVAESDSYEVVDGNIYVGSLPLVYPVDKTNNAKFPPSSVNKSSFSPTATQTYCPYKGQASYYTVTTGKTEVTDAAWYYPDPKPGYEKIKGFVAFYKGKAEVQSS